MTTSFVVNFVNQFNLNILISFRRSLNYYQNIKFLMEIGDEAKKIKLNN